MFLAFLHIRLLDILDIFLVAFLLYQIYQLIKGTTALSIFIGIFIVYVLWIVVKALNMDLLGSILGQVIGVGVIALIIVFQQELRRFLLIIGTRYLNRENFSIERIFSFNIKREVYRVKINSIVLACKHMSKTKTGALIVLGRKTGLKSYTESGDLLNAETSSRLIESIFFKNSPLHDGAVLIEGKKILAARCVLPTTSIVNLPANYGMRHRAAIGITEETDALAIIVSEETGRISLASTAVFASNLSPEELKEKLIEELKVVDQDQNIEKNGTQKDS